jgi:hypothetical protein
VPRLGFALFEIGRAGAKIARHGSGLGRHNAKNTGCSAVSIPGCPFAQILVEMRENN